MEPPGYRSFLVRLWRESGVGGAERLCGEVEHIQSGHAWRFSSFDSMIALLRATGATTAPDPAPPRPAEPDPG